ncbi:RNA polymerase sigma factor [Phenylobacterium sp.]|jgi:RNA polymerase sigma-70 factor (ECF subfamily)|uniref:RNA polymerase sigma factor n=1 Tax=Phenylobacterium sp. TaxID=1871053 RepID=UPI002F92CABF
MQANGKAIAAARPRVVAALAARLRDLDLAEDAFADAAAAALSVWPQQAPRDPAAWLWKAAFRRALDARRRAAVRQRAVLDAPEPEPTPEEALLAADEPIPDERLKLIFVCCHPAIALDARAALTLKVVCGLSTERLARAFLVAEPAMLQRITRAKRKIAGAGVPFEVPQPSAWPERMEAVLATLEIAYAQAYEDAALAGDAAGFAPEVLRLSGLLAELVPDDPEVLGLAALVRFAEARRPARLDDLGAMVPPHEQDMALWRRDLMAEGAALMARAARIGRSGPRQILAAIHGAHLSRRETGETPWADIAGLYDVLLAVRPTPVTAVNRAVAVGEAFGAERGLAALGEVDAERLQSWLPWHAARAGLAEKAGLRVEAVEALEAALNLGPPPAERLFLERRLRALAH